MIFIDFVTLDGNTNDMTVTKILSFENIDSIVYYLI